MAKQLPAKITLPLRWAFAPLPLLLDFTPRHVEGVLGQLSMSTALDVVHACGLLER